MIHILAKVSVEELSHFLSVFSTRGVEVRKKHSSLHSQVFKVENPALQETASAGSLVYILFEWESREAFDAFLQDPQVKETMKSSGTLGAPEFTILEKVGDFPG